MKIAKTMNNLEIAELLRDVAASYELQNKDKNFFKITAYNRAADAVEHLSSEAKDIWDEGKLDDIPGVGKSIAQHLSEIFKTGKSEHFSDLMKDIPSNVFELMELPGIGVKSAFKLVKELKLSSSRNILKDVENMAKKGKIAEIEGFGKESQAEILNSIIESGKRVKRLLLPYADNIADEVIDWMKKADYVKSADKLGSLRRKAPTIGDIDISVATDKPLDALQRFTEYPKTVRVIEKGAKTASILLPGGVQVDLMVQKPESYGSLLQHFTGSKHHNIALREYAIRKDMSLSEYGIKKIKQRNSKLKVFDSEKDFYKYLGMEWISPELREDAGEIEKAVYQTQGKPSSLPNLVNLDNIKADLQIHSDFDVETSHDLGQSTASEIIEKADDLGYEYIAFTEHNPSRSKHSDLQIIEILKRKKEYIENINYSIVKTMKGRIKKVFNSLEIDIMPDGDLAIPEKGFEYLDFALVSIHSSFNQTREEATKRVINSFKNPKIKIFAHPTGRKLNERESVEFNWPEIFEACIKKDVWLEINADPMRLDLPDFLIREAVKKNLLLTLGTDAHHTDSMNNMKWGVYAARRGWASKRNIVNTRSLEDFENMIK